MQERENLALPGARGSHVRECMRRNCPVTNRRNAARVDLSFLSALHGTGIAPSEYSPACICRKKVSRGKMVDILINDERRRTKHDDDDDCVSRLITRRRSSPSRDGCSRDERARTRRPRKRAPPDPRRARYHPQPRFVSVSRSILSTKTIIKRKGCERAVCNI